MRRYFMTLFFCLATILSCVAQQKLVFTNQNSGKMEIVRQADMVRLVYRGYLGQVQDIYGRIEIINDSLVRFEDNWSVRVSDIIGFRKFNKYRDVIKGVTDVVVLVGAIVAIPVLINSNPGLTTAGRIGLSFSIGLAASAINSVLFPTRIKNFMSAGWVVKVE